MAGVAGNYVHAL